MLHICVGLGPYVEGCCGKIGAMHGPLLYPRPFPALFQIIVQQNTHRLTAQDIVKETCKYSGVSALTDEMLHGGR